MKLRFFNTVEAFCAAASRSHSVWGTNGCWWRGVRGGDVLLFVVSLALVNYVYEWRPTAVRSAMMRKALSNLNGEGWVDKVSIPGKPSTANAGEPSEGSEKKEV